jgi:hypothetical protein
MISRTPWNERKFNFEFPVTNFPCIFVRLKGTSPRIEDYIKDLSEEQLLYKPNNKWSIKEHIGHLADIDELHEGRLEDYKNKAAILRPADMTNLKTNQGSHNNTPVSKLLNDFRKARNRFLKHLELLDETALSQSSIHPRLNQPMRIVDMVFFVAEHDDQHLAAIYEIANGFN